MWVLVKTVSVRNEITVESCGLFKKKGFSFFFCFVLLHYGLKGTNS